MNAVVGSLAERGRPITRSTPMVSVVLPTYNRSRTVVRSVESVLSQTFRDLELIVVDDGSSDDTIDVLSKIPDARLKVFPLSMNSGAAAARNSGIRKARGRYIAFLDSDDFWDRNKLARQLNFMRLEGASRLSCTGFHYVADGKEIATRISKPLIATDDLLNGCDCSPGSTLVAERSLFDEVGYFNDHMARLEDWEWLLRCSTVSHIAVLQEPLTTVEARVRSDSMYSKVAASVPHLEHTIGRLDIVGSRRKETRAVMTATKASVAYLDGRYLLAAIQLMTAGLQSPAVICATMRRIVARIAHDIGSAARRLGYVKDGRHVEALPRGVSNPTFSRPLR